MKAYAQRSASVERAFRFRLPSEGLHFGSKHSSVNDSFRISAPAWFVALPFAHRTALTAALLGPTHPEKEMWVGLALFSNMAFDSAAHLHTAEALAAGHPGLTQMGFTLPDADGLWRFPAYSYGRRLAALHPHTTVSGSPA